MAINLPAPKRAPNVGQFSADAQKQRRSTFFFGGVDDLRDDLLQVRSAKPTATQAAATASRIH
jgi:hypothetical protein